MDSRGAKPQRLPNSRMKNKMVYFCQVDGCKTKLSNFKPYCVRYRVCPAHLAALQVQLHGEASRFCQQCGKFHIITEFDGNKRSCRTRLKHHNSSRQQRRKEVALQHSATTCLILQHTGARPAPGRRVTQPTLDGTAAHDAAAAAAAVATGSEPHSMAGDSTQQPGHCSNSDNSSSQRPAHRTRDSVQQQPQQRSKPASTLDLSSTPAGSAQQEASGVNRGSPQRDTYTATQQQQQQQQEQQQRHASADASGAAKILWEFFANQGPYTDAAAAGAAAALSTLQASLPASAGILDSCQQQLQVQQHPAGPAAASAAAAASDRAWPSPLSSSITPRQLQPAQLGCSASSSPAAVQVTQQLPAAAAAAARWYFGSSSSSPASMPLTAGSAAAGSAAAGSAARLLVQGVAEATPLQAAASEGCMAAGAGAPPRLTPFGSASSAGSAARHRAVPAPVAAAAASPGRAVPAGAAGSGAFNSPGSQPLSQTDIWGTDNANCCGMHHAFSSITTAGGSFSCMPLRSFAAAAAASPQAPSTCWHSPSSCSPNASTAAGAACVTANSTAAGGAYSPGATGCGSSYSIGLSVLRAAGLNFRSMGTSPGCIKCPPYVGSSSACAAALQGCTAAASNEGSSFACIDNSQLIGVAAGAEAATVAPAAAAGQGYALQPAAAAAAALPSTMPRGWQGMQSTTTKTSPAAAWDRGSADAARLYKQADQQTEQRQQSQCNRQAACTQIPAAAVPQQYSQEQYSQQRHYSMQGPDWQYSLAAVSTSSTPAPAAAGSLTPPYAIKTAGHGAVQELMLGMAADTVMNSIAVQPPALPVTPAAAASAAHAAAHCDVWSSLHISREQQQQLSAVQHQRQFCCSYGGAAADTAGAAAAAASRAGTTEEACSADAAQGILYGHPERLATGMQGAACFATKHSSPAHISSMPWVPRPAVMELPAVLVGLPVDCPAAELARHNTPNDGFTGAGLQGGLPHHLSAAAAEQQQQQQQRCLFAGSAPKHVVFTAAGSAQQLLQPSTPQVGQHTPHGTWAAAPTGWPTASGIGSGCAAPATGGTWQPAPRDTAPLAVSTAPCSSSAAAAAAAEDCLLPGFAQLANGAAAAGDGGDAAGGGGGVAGPGGNPGGCCEALLGSSDGIHELLHTWGAEGDDEQIESLALLLDVDLE